MWCCSSASESCSARYPISSGCDGFSRKARAAAARRSVAKIVELQGHADVRLAQKRDGFLQVVALFAGDAHLLALNLRLHLQLRVLEQPRHLPARVGVDPMLQYRELFGSRKIDLGVLHLEAGDIDAALGH